MNLQMWHNSLKDLIKSCALKRWTERYRGTAHGFFLNSPIQNELLFHRDSRCRGVGGKKMMIKVNVLCVRGWRKPLCWMSRFLVRELQSPRSHQHTCREHVANNTESGFDIICDANQRLDIGLTTLVSSFQGYKLSICLGVTHPNSHQVRGFNEQFLRKQSALGFLKFPSIEPHSFPGRLVPLPEAWEHKGPAQYLNVPGAALFWTDIGDVVPRIYWSHSSSLRCSKDLLSNHCQARVYLQFLLFFLPDVAVIGDSHIYNCNTFVHLVPQRNVQMVHYHLFAADMAQSCYDSWVQVFECLSQSDNPCSTPWGKAGSLSYPRYVTSSSQG